MADVKFSQLPGIGGNITNTAIVPIVQDGFNYTVTAANLATFVSEGIDTYGNANVFNYLGSNSNVNLESAGNITLRNDGYTGIVRPEILSTYHDTQANITRVESGRVTIYSTAESGPIIRLAGNLDYPDVSTTSIQTSNRSAGVSVTSYWGGLGNVTANYFLGNGSQLTGLPQSYGNANVAAYLPEYSGNIGNGAGYVFGNGSQLTGITAVSTYGNANVANYLPTYSGSIGTITVPSITATNTNGLRATGSNGSTGTSRLAAFVDAGQIYFQYQGDNRSAGPDIIRFDRSLPGPDVTPLLLDMTNGRVGINDITPEYTLDVAGTGRFTANLTANYFIGNGSQLTGITAVSSYGNANVANYLPTYSGSIGTLTSPNSITANELILPTSNDISGSLLFYENPANGTQSIRLQAPPAFGTSAWYYLPTGIGGAGQVLTTPGTGNISTPTQLYWSNAASSYGNANVAAYLPTYGGNIGNGAGYVFGNGSQLTGITATPVLAGNLSGNLFSSNSYLSYTNYSAFDSTTARPMPANAFVRIGSGFNGAGDWTATSGFYGDYLNSIRNARVQVADAANVTSGTRYYGLAAQFTYNTGGQTLTTGTRGRALQAELHIDGGGNLITEGLSSPQWRASTTATTLGQTTPTTITGDWVNTSAFQEVRANSVVTGRSICYVADNSHQANASVGGAVGFVARFRHLGTATGNAVAFGADAGENGSWGNTYTADQRWFLKCDEPTAQSSLGRVQNASESAYPHPTTGGAITVDANSGIFQRITLNSNITGLTLANFNTGSGNYNSSQIVTLMIRQDSTGGRTFVWPTGAGYYYSGGTPVISSAANSYTTVTIRAVWDTVSSTNHYFISAVSNWATV